MDEKKLNVQKPYGYDTENRLSTLESVYLDFILLSAGR
jgi:hypothetical protein